MNSLFSDTRVGTAGGTLLVIILNINGGEIVKTAVLACVGAVVSFFVSIVLKWMVKRGGGG